MIDVNVYLSRWPFRRLPCDETPRLVERLQSAGVTAAWAGSFDALLHPDVAQTNARLAAECRDHAPGFLVPFGAVNPTLPDWEDDVRRCREQHGMSGIRLHPDYHGYRLDDPRCAALLDLAGDHELIVQIAVKMEDERTQHPLVRVPAADIGPLHGMISRRPQLRVVLLNALRLRDKEIAKLAGFKNVSFEISMLEGVGGLDRLLKVVPFERLLFGSLFPLFSLDAALLKLRESTPGHTVIAAISQANARRLIENGGTRRNRYD